MERVQVPGRRPGLSEASGHGGRTGDTRERRAPSVRTHAVSGANFGHCWRTTKRTPSISATWQTGDPEAVQPRKVSSLSLRKVPKAGRRAPPPAVRAPSATDFEHRPQSPRHSCDRDPHARRAAPGTTPWPPATIESCDPKLRRLSPVYGGDAPSHLRDPQPGWSVDLS